MKILHRRPWLRLWTVVGAALFCGCSLLDRDEESPLSTPPMIGAADPAKPPKVRGKYRFASEVSNVRSEHLATRRKSAAVDRLAAEGNFPPQAVGLAVQTRAAERLVSQGPGAYPTTGAETLAASFAPARPMTQRLPDVNQVSLGTPPQP